MDDGKLVAAYEACIEIGAIGECLVHCDVYVDNMEFGDAEGIVAEIVKYKPEVLAQFSGRDELLKYIDAVYKDVAMDCGYCAKNAAD